MSLPINALILIICNLITRKPKMVNGIPPKFYQDTILPLLHVFLRPVHLDQPSTLRPLRWEYRRVRTLLIPVAGEAEAIVQSSSLSHTEH